MLFAFFNSAEVCLTKVLLLIVMPPFFFACRSEADKPYTALPLCVGQREDKASDLGNIQLAVFNVSNGFYCQFIRMLINQRSVNKIKPVLPEIRRPLAFIPYLLQDLDSKRMLNEVQSIKGPEHNFLLGFYYRLQGRPEDAISKLKACIGFTQVEARARQRIKSP